MIWKIYKCFWMSSVHMEPTFPADAVSDAANKTAEELQVSAYVKVAEIAVRNAFLEVA